MGAGGPGWPGLGRIVTVTVCEVIGESWASDVITSGDPVSAWMKLGHSAHPQQGKIADEKRGGEEERRGL